jgi:hypothetical protein
LHKAGEAGVLESGNEKAPEGKIADTGNQNKNLDVPLQSRPAPMLTDEGTPVSPVKSGFMQRTLRRKKAWQSAGDPVIIRPASFVKRLSDPTLYLRSR